MNRKDIAIKLTDFGMATYIDSNIEGTMGTPLYMSPEILRGTGHNSTADIWSTGVIAHEILSGDIPFNGQSIEDLQRSIINDDVRFNGQAWNNLSHEAQDFVD